MISDLRALLEDAQDRQAQQAACAVVAIVAVPTGVAAHFGFSTALVVAGLTYPAALYGVARLSRVSLLVLPLACIFTVVSVVRVFRRTARS